MTKVLIFVVKRNCADATVILRPIPQNNINIFTVIILLIPQNNMNMLVLVFLVKTRCVDATVILRPIPQNNINIFSQKKSCRRNCYYTTNTHEQNVCFDIKIKSKKKFWREIFYTYQNFFLREKFTRQKILDVTNYYTGEW